MGSNQSTEFSNSSTSQAQPCHLVLIWLDSTLDEHNQVQQTNIAHLRRFINTIHLFTNVDQCHNFLEGLHNEKVFLVVSAILGRTSIAIFHGMSQLDSIYIYCNIKCIHQQWIKRFPKIKAVETTIPDLCRSLKQSTQNYDDNFIPISFVNAQETINQLDPSFMYTQILKEILFEITYDRRSVTDFASYCRGLYANNPHELRNISKFEREYHGQSVIRWYTYNCCVYSILNRALRNLEVETIIRMGFFIHDLHMKIEYLYKQQFHKRRRKIRPFVVYRGQNLPQTDFDKLMKTKGGLLSFNNFLSTSKKRDVALSFARHAVWANPNSSGIVFQMMIDPSILSAPYASLKNTSYYKDSEQEILFSTNTIFRIDDIKRFDTEDDNFWQVDLILTKDNDQQLSALTERIRREIQEEAQQKFGWPRLGNLLIRLGNFNAAENVYSTLLKLTVNDIEHAYLCHQMGVIKDSQQSYTEAIEFYKKSFEIYQKNFPSTHPLLAMCYKSMAVTYNNMKEYSDALRSQHKALQIEEYILPRNHISLVITHNSIGLISYSMREYTTALLFYQSALEIAEKILPKNHPMFAICYNNIGAVYKNLGDYHKAVDFHTKAVETSKRSLCTNHPHFQIFQDNLSSVSNQLNEQ
ncbi:unnamed protein product [Adineta ricciae]|uniref:Uncharacterized protein n=1 Tax=Adineta ricciae TaxID=249248 RepID=A0A814W3J9_ADIRI|nr:unnamed protein product [Adineta ricciae]CAF1448810.1 unnamed protein product [Adineta ricciae]